MKYGAIEAGGTKFVCGAGTEPDNLVIESFPTAMPDETLRNVVQFFRRNEPLAAIGIGSFGPVDLRTGNITATPKKGWAHFPFQRAIEDALQVPVAFDTDVNTAALGESLWGAGLGLSNLVYLTIGTGIGGGAIVEGKLVHGLVHPEMGHLRLPRNSMEDPFPGCCPYHGDCLEGLASGPALAARWNTDPSRLPHNHRAWELEARYLALAAANIMFTLSPERIVLGGGVMSNEFLFPLIHKEFDALVNGYVPYPADYIVPPGLGPRSGIAGALALAKTLKPLYL